MSSINYVPGVFYGTLEVKLNENDPVETIKVVQLRTLIGKIIHFVQNILCCGRIEKFHLQNRGGVMAHNFSVSRRSLELLLTNKAKNLNMIPTSDWVNTAIDNWKGIGKPKTMWDWDSAPFIDELIEETFVKKDEK